MALYILFVRHTKFLFEQRSDSKILFQLNLYIPVWQNQQYQEETFDCFMRQTLQKDEHWLCFQKSHITYRLSVLTLACLTSVSLTAHSFHWGPQKQHLTFSLEAFRPKEQHCCCTTARNNWAWYLVSDELLTYLKIVHLTAHCLSHSLLLPHFTLPPSQSKATALLMSAGNSQQSYKIPL